MRIKKIYFNRRYNQWRDEPIFVEDEIYDEGLCVHMVDVKFERGSINTIIADFKDSNGATYSVEGVADYNKKTATFKIPPQILSNDGIYEVVFSISYNGKSKFVRTAIQTFTIRDTIEINDEVIQQETNYPVLVDLINNMANYKVDTSNFPTREEMMEAIQEGANATSIEEMLIVLERKGYITREDLNRILSSYATKASLSSYATQSDLNKFVTNLKFIQELDKYQLKTSMNNYVLKENGKGLSTHDLTDELYNKLIEGNASSINWEDVQNKPNIPSKTSELTNDSNFVNETYVANKIAEAQLKQEEVDLSGFATKKELEDKADKTEIPTKISQLTNDSNFLTSIPSEYITEDKLIEKGYALKTDLHTHSNKDILDNITSDKIDSWDNKSDFSGSYNDLTDKPTIPSINNTTISETEVYSSSKTEERLSEIEMNIDSDITAVSDGVIEIDERVNYLEEKQLIIDAFDGTYDSLLNRPSIVSPNDVLTKNNTELYRPISRYNPTTKEYVDDSVAIELLNLSLVVDNGNEVYSSNSFIDYLNEIAKHFISENIILGGDNLKYYHIFRGKLDPTNPNTKEKLPLTIEEKEYNNITYFSMLNHPYNILTTFIFANEGNLRIESPWTAQYDDGDMYSSITITDIGTMYELIGAGGVATDNNVATDEEITQMLDDIFGGEK